MEQSVRIFVSYSHRDKRYLGDDSLLGFLAGLESDGIEIWTDQEILGGDRWEERLRSGIDESDIILALVSQGFLDSKYCTDVEIRGAIARSAVIFPVLLSPCEWERHAWLRSRQFLPAGGETVEQHFQSPGDLKRLFLEIRGCLRSHAERIRAARRETSSEQTGPVPVNPFGQALALRDPALFVGRDKELRRLFNLLEGGSAAILGDPKIGKSSLLWRLVDSWPGEILGPFDFQAVDDLEDFWTDLAGALGVPSPEWRELRAVLRQRKTLLLLDELDQGPDRGFDGEALARFRSVCSANPFFRMVVVSRIPLKRVFPDDGLGSPVYNFLQPLTLPLMPEPEARLLLGHPWAPSSLPFDEAMLAQLLDLGQGHPFKLQRAGFHRYEALADPGHPWLEAWRQDMEHML